MTVGSPQFVWTPDQAKPAAATTAMAMEVLQAVLGMVDRREPLDRPLQENLHELARHVSLLTQQVQSIQTALADTCDTTIEGWSRVLDLRDEGTEGHSRRVADMTVRLAEAMGMDAAQIREVRRGALLHDIGKMGIPDCVLFKPGPLTDDEWKIMRMHPLYAYELLWPIEFLRGSLDIPYCHHEKWDGSGYPRGLRGRDIPAAARAFALADVWDALTSARPYRQPWSAERTVEHIRFASGSAFDPEIVELFLRLDKPIRTGSEIASPWPALGIHYRQSPWWLQWDHE